MSEFDDFYRGALGLFKNDEAKNNMCNDARTFTSEEEAHWIRSLEDR